MRSMVEGWRTQSTVCDGGPSTAFQAVPLPTSFARREDESAPLVRLLRRRRRAFDQLVEVEPVLHRELVDHVHHLELQPRRLVGRGVPERDDAAFALRVEHDQRTIAAHAAAVTYYAVACIIIHAPAEAVGRAAETL